MPAPEVRLSELRAQASVFSARSNATTPARRPRKASDLGQRVTSRKGFRGNTGPFGGLE